jgi:4-alpha-glucanotransferase
MHVLQFDVDIEGFALTDIEPDSVCYTGTHDNDTTVGWFRGSPDDLRTPQAIAATQAATLALTNGTPASIHLDMIRAAFASPARIAIAPLQDFLGLGSEARTNTPGTSHGNWRWRVTESQLGTPLRRQVAALVADARRR